MSHQLKTKISLVASAVALLSLSSGASASIPETQQSALRAIYVEMEGENWPEYSQPGWSATGEVSCSAEFITCDDAENVIGLEFIQSQTSTAQVSSRISELTELEYFGLMGTGMITAIPESLTTLPKLTYMQLDDYHFAGPVPSWIGNFPALETLIIVATKFTGPLPDSIGQLSTLTSLTIPVNDYLDGSIPASLGNLTGLERLILSGNQFEGQIPDELGNLQNLTWLDLSNNLLVGEVPLGLYSNPDLDFDQASANLNAYIGGNALYTTDQAQLNHAIYSQLSPTEQAHDAKITGLAYLGDDQASITWQVHDWHLDQEITADLDSTNSRDNSFAVYSRTPAGTWQFLTAIEDSNTRSWQGSVPGLSASQAVEIQVRRTIGSELPSLIGNERSLAESSGEQAGPTLIDSTQAGNNMPSFTSQGEVLDLAPGSFVEIPGWATNLDDGDNNTQGLYFNLKYMSNNSLFGNTPHISTPSGSLRFNTSAQASGESLVVYELCDIPTDLAAPACSEQVVFKVGVDNSSVPLPSFQASTGITTGSADLQEHTLWATGMSDGTGTDHYLSFHTLWVTNSDLFEQDPWISTPSGSLRFQFKDGASGTAKAYVTLKDNMTGLTSSIHEIVLTKTPNTEAQRDLDAKALAPDTGASTASDDTIVNASSNVINSDSVSNGGGGSAGFAVFALGLLGFRRKS